MVLQFMAQGATVITPNNRLSHELLGDFFNAHSTTVLEKPRCLPYQDFLRNLFNAHCKKNRMTEHPILLSLSQLRYLWGQVISNQYQETMNHALIDEIHEAWTRCQRWQLDINHPLFSYTPQSRQFQEWAQQLQHILDKRQLISDDQLVNYITSRQIKIEPATIVWHCFNDYTPEQVNFQHFLTQQQCTIIHTDLQNTASNVSMYAANDIEDEYKQLITWLNLQLEQGCERIGVVVPELEKQAENLGRHLQQHIPAPLFNISMGKPLYEYSLVAHALCWLNLNGETLTNHQARLLLYSPYVSYSSTEMLARMQSLHDCPLLQETIIDQAALQNALQAIAPKLVQSLKSLVKYQQSWSPQEWITAFLGRLASLGFPGEMPLNSATYQCLQRFLSIFEEFKQLNLLTEELSVANALSIMDNLTKTSIFQPEKSNASIQILGLLEASGGQFDSLWVSGMTDECLPPKTRLSAFIPVPLQRDLQMPHASTARELLLASKIMGRFKKSSANCIISYPQITQDKPNLASPLIKNLPSFPAYKHEIPLTTSALENYIECYQLELAVDEKVMGGSALLANQAKCPFRAFAAHRLHAKKEVMISDGANARERGQIIHKVMEVIWQNLQNQQTLLTKPASELDALIQQAIAIALKPYIELRQHSFSPVIQEIELSRLNRLVNLSLDWEKQRPSFEIEALEQAFTLELGGMDFNLRIDRLDSVAGGKKWVIDYKSSVPAALPWREERPKEPQLLLYALLDHSITTLLFSGLKEGQLINKGLSEDSLELTGINTIKKEENWSDYRDTWQQQLTELAEEYSQGYCQPEPISTAICQQCDYQSLCRYAFKE